VDLAQIFNCPPLEPHYNRLTPAELTSLRATLAAAGLQIDEGSAADKKLSELRRMYEPYVYSLSRHLGYIIPPWIPESGRADNWQTSVWGRSTGFEIDGLPKGGNDEHFL
jgi:hypothetical protein